MIHDVAFSIMRNYLPQQQELPLPLFQLQQTYGHPGPSCLSAAEIFASWLHRSAAHSLERVLLFLPSRLHPAFKVGTIKTLRQACYAKSEIDSVSIAATKKYSSVPLTACLSPLSLDLFHMALKLFIAAARCPPSPRPRSGRTF